MSLHSDFTNFNDEINLFTEAFGDEPDAHNFFMTDTCWLLKYQIEIISKEHTCVEHYNIEVETVMLDETQYKPVDDCCVLQRKFQQYNNMADIHTAHNYELDICHTTLKLSAHIHGHVVDIYCVSLHLYGTDGTALKIDLTPENEDKTLWTLTFDYPKILESDTSKYIPNFSRYEKIQLCIGGTYEYFVIEQQYLNFVSFYEDTQIYQYAYSS